MGLVQACHRLSVSTAERSGKLSGQSLEDCIECFAQDTTRDEEGKMDYLQLSLEQPQEVSGTSKKLPSPAFMTMDLRALSDADVGGDAEGAKKKQSGRVEVEFEVGNFLEEVLGFVRDHLVSRPLLMAVAATAERGANGRGGSEDEGIQEGLILLCEVCTSGGNMHMLQHSSTVQAPAGHLRSGGIFSPVTPFVPDEPLESRNLLPTVNNLQFANLYLYCSTPRCTFIRSSCCYCDLSRPATGLQPPVVTAVTSLRGLLFRASRTRCLRPSSLSCRCRRSWRSPKSSYSTRYVYMYVRLSLRRGFLHPAVSSVVLGELFCDEHVLYDCCVVWS